jgi:hypothetical protein
MADLMEERIHSIQRTSGFAFVISAVILATTMLVHPSFPDVNNTGNVLQSITAAKGDAWMQVHAIMAVGFVIAAIALCAFGFLLHFRGSSGSASIVMTCALLGAGIWVTFLTAELYTYRFFANWFGVDAGGATMLFSTVWFWKLGALYAGALLFFGAVIFAGIAGVKRDILPVWLGGGGALIAIVGALVYAMDFWSSTATGRASQPMQWPAMRYGVGLPLQLWMLGVGVTMLMEYFSRPVAARVTHAPVRPIGEHPARRAGEGMISHPEPPAAVPPTPPAAASGGGASAQGGYTAGVSHPTGAKIPHPALAPEPEPPQQQRPTGTDPARPKPPQIFPG